LKNTPPPRPTRKYQPVIKGKIMTGESEPEEVEEKERKTKYTEEN
jgi:hypothetical protein